MCVLICIFAITFHYTLAASSVDIDGYQSGTEWNGATVDKLIDGESNCGVNFAVVKTLIDADNNALNLCFMIIDPSLDSGNQNAGVSVYVDNSQQFDITLSDSVLSSDSSTHSFDAAIRVDENHGVICEIRIGFKHGLPETISATTRFIDADGALSNVCNFSIINNFYSETTELVIDSEEKETTKAKATSKKKTTKYSTDPETVYVYVTNKKTTQKKTTKFYIQTSPPYSYVRKTKSQTTKKSSESTAAKTTRSKPATVYYYEKEVIISHIYISEAELLTTAEPTTIVTEAINAASFSDSISSDEQATELKSSFSLSDGMNYKIFILVFGAISFATIAAIGVKNSRKNTDKNDNPDSQ